MRLLTNFIQRWWWLLLGQFLLTICLWLIGGIVVHFEVLPVIVMSLDLMRGLSRSVMAFPVARKTFARMIWVSAVVLPIVLSLSAMSVAFLLSSKISFYQYLWHCAVGVVFPGLVMFILTGLPTRPSEGAWGKVRDSLFGALWGLSISGSSFLSIFQHRSEFPVNVWTLTGLGLAAVLSVVSYFTVESMAVSRANRTQIQTVPHRTANVVESARGWPVWCKIELRWHVMLGVIVVFGMAMSAVITSSMMSRNPTGLYTQLGMFAMMTLMPVFAVGIGSLRSLRALPISSATLATLFLLRPFIQSLIISGVLLACMRIFSIENNQPTALHTIILLGGAAALVQAFLLRNPMRWLAFVILSFAAPFLMALSFLAPMRPGYSWMLLPAALVAYLLAWFLTHHNIRSSSKLYRTQNWFFRILGGAARS